MKTSTLKKPLDSGLQKPVKDSIGSKKQPPVSQDQLRKDKE